MAVTAAVPALLDVVDGRLGAVAALRGRPTVLVHGRLGDDTARLLHDALRGLPGGPLDLVLSTLGGSPTAAVRVAGVLHEAVGPDRATGRLGILVPARARSAGTLLCLGADELVLTALAELGPLDPLLEGTAGGAPVSAADLRAFRELATDWFGVPDGSGLELLGLLGQRMLPTSLARLHRLDALVRELAARQLRRHLPGEPDARIAAVVERLVAGYHSHDQPILRAEARELGLRVTDASAAESAALLGVLDAAEAVLAAAADDGTPLGTLVRPRRCDPEVPA